MALQVTMKNGPMDRTGKIYQSIYSQKFLKFDTTLIPAHAKYVFYIFSVDHSSVASASKMHLFGNGDNVAAAVAAYGASLNSGTNSGASNSIHANAVNCDAGRALTGNSVNGQNQLNSSLTSSNNATAESIMELSTKMLQVQQQQFNSSQNSQTSLSTTGSSTSSMFPPKSQIKRQKMIYHCKVCMQ